MTVLCDMCWKGGGGDRVLRELNMKPRLQLQGQECTEVPSEDVTADF